MRAVVLEFHPEQRWIVSTLGHAREAEGDEATDRALYLQVISSELVHYNDAPAGQDRTDGIQDGDLSHVVISQAGDKVSR